VDPDPDQRNLFTREEPLTHLTVVVLSVLVEGISRHLSPDGGHELLGDHTLHKLERLPVLQHGT
jgi:hypothetical protein